MRKSKEVSQIIEGMLSKISGNKQKDKPKDKKLFGMDLRVGDMIPTAFCPDRHIHISANTTPEFIHNLKAQLSELREPLPDIKVLKKLESNLSNMELKFFMNVRMATRQAEQHKRVYH